MTLIVGRAIAGFGSAGVLTRSFVVVATCCAAANEAHLYGRGWRDVSCLLCPYQRYIGPAHTNAALGSGLVQALAHSWEASLQILWYDCY